MFTGIVEGLGRVVAMVGDENQKTFTIESSFAQELIPGQSVAHNGVCLTVEKIDAQASVYNVTLIRQTLERSSLASLRVSSNVNLERCVRADARLDGHVVQGHVDSVGTIVLAENEPGQKRFRIEFPDKFASLIVPRGSICVDGISLTVANSGPGQVFDVCLIPHTLEVTIASQWEVGTTVNLEFDIIGKYVKKWMDLRG